MHVPDIGPPFPRFHKYVVQIKITIILLSRLDGLYNVLDGFVKDRIVFLSEEVYGTLHPFPEVTVPEKMRRDGPISVVVVDWVPFQLEAVVAASAFE